MALWQMSLLWTWRRESTYHHRLYLKQLGDVMNIISQKNCGQEMGAGDLLTCSLVVHKTVNY
jgi:hypothetical protein